MQHTHTLLCKSQETLRRLSLGNVQMLLPYPTKQSYPLGKHSITLKVVCRYGL